MIQLMSSGSHRSSAVNNLAFVKETSFTETTATTSGTVTPANTAGSLLVMMIGAHGSALQTVSNCGSPGSNTDPGGNVWTKVTPTETSAVLDAEMWYTVTTAIAGVVTVTFTGATTIVLSCQEWSGANATPFDIAKGLTGTPPSTGNSATTGNALDVCIAFTTGYTNNAYSGQTAGYTVLTQHNSASGLPATLQSAYLLLSAKGVQKYGAAITSGNVQAAILATFKSS